MNPMDLVKKKNDVQGYAPLKAGWYLLRFHEADTRVGKTSGKEYESVTFKICHNTGNRNVWLNLPTGTVTEKGQEYLSSIWSQLLYALGDKIDISTLSGSFHEILNEFCVDEHYIVAYLKPQRDNPDRLEVSTFDHKQEYQDAVNLGSYVPMKPRKRAPVQSDPSAGLPPSDMDLYDDDIPF